MKNRRRGSWTSFRWQANSYLNACVRFSFSVSKFANNYSFYSVFWKDSNCAISLKAMLQYIDTLTSTCARHADVLKIVLVYLILYIIIHNTDSQLFVVMFLGTTTFFFSTSFLMYFFRTVQLQPIYITLTINLLDTDHCQPGLFHYSRYECALHT